MSSPSQAHCRYAMHIRPIFAGSQQHPQARPPVAAGRYDNEAIASGKAATASEAAKLAGLSRSAYYKYKDGVRPFFEATTDRIVTFHFMLHDQPGMLSSILGLMAKSGANLMTVNQSIPMRGQASVTIAARTGEMKYSVEELLHRAEQLEGVNKVEILASE